MATNSWTYERDRNNGSVELVSREQCSGSLNTPQDNIRLTLVRKTWTAPITPLQGKSLRSNSRPQRNVLDGGGAIMFIRTRR
jgi:hypothetical protein